MSLLGQYYFSCTVATCSNLNCSLDRKSLHHDYLSTGMNRDHHVHCPPWYEENVDSPKSCVCRKNQPFHAIKCTDGLGGQLQLGLCMSRRESDGVYTIGSCPYSWRRGSVTVTNDGYVILPDNVSELNDYLCHPMNRTGPMCHQCIPGYGPSLTSVKFQCTNCTSHWYGAFLYLFVEFVPITVLYLLILVFRINITSAPMTCFIMYIQLVLFELNYNRANQQVNYLLTVISIKSDQNYILQALLAVCDFINLEFLHHIIVPPFCISSKLHDIHIVLLGYLSAFYPLCLILLTWICIELHDCNFRPLVLLWKPFHRCCVRLRKGWSSKNDLIDAFSSFFLLSYSKILYQSSILVGCCRSVSFDESGNFTQTLYAKCIDPGMSCKDIEHLKVTIPAAIVICLFNILPALLLVLYPVKAFRACLSKCRLDRIAITVFVEKFHGCYRDGLEGGRDMRSFSGAYFFLRFSFLVYYLFPFIQELVSLWICRSLGFVTISLIIAYVRPYRKKYMNIVDTLLLVNLAAVSHLASQNLSTIRVYVVFSFVLLPVLVFILVCVSLATIKVRKILCYLVGQACKRCWHKVLLVHADNEGFCEDTNQHQFVSLIT